MVRCVASSTVQYSHPLFIILSFLVYGIVSSRANATAELVLTHAEDQRHASKLS